MMAPREAMQQAIERAQVGDYEGGHVWTSIARELRLGATPAPVPEPQHKGLIERIVEHGTSGGANPADRIYDYHRGQEELPTLGAFRYAIARQRLIDAGGLATTEERTLLREIIERGELPEPVEAKTLSGETRLVPMPAPEPAYRRAETEVLHRIQDEPTPAYEAAGETLGETRAIPTNIAHPQPDSVGPRSRCLNPECGLVVLWIVGRGWVHDVEGHPAGCEHAAEVSRRA